MNQNSFIGLIAVILIVLFLICGLVFKPAQKVTISTSLVASKNLAKSMTSNNTERYALGFGSSDLYKVVENDLGIGLGWKVMKTRGFPKAFRDGNTIEFATGSNYGVDSVKIEGQSPGLVKQMGLLFGLTVRRVSDFDRLSNKFFGDNYILRPGKQTLEGVVYELIRKDDRFIFQVYPKCLNSTLSPNSSSGKSYLMGLRSFGHYRFYQILVLCCNGYSWR